MKKLILLFILFPFISFAQINFEQGYIIRNNNTKTECLIKNVAWKNNPTVIEFKENETAQSQTISINEMKEFGVGNAYKYKKFTVQIDRSSNNLNTISNQKAPEFKTETVFLKFMTQGELNLYSYEDGNFVRYFVGAPDKDAEQLIYKTYDDQKGSIIENVQFKQQLMNLLKSDKVTRRDFERLDYKEKDLVNLFEKVYGAENSNFSNFKSKETKGSVNFKVVVGANFANAKIENSEISNSEISFDRKAIPSFGLEIEYVMPFNQNKWSLFFNPSYQKFESSQKKGYLTADFDYSYIDLAFGVRHYFFLNEKSKIFADLGYTLVVPTEATFKYGTGKLEVSKGSNLFFGTGFSYTRFSIEARYNFKRQFLNNYLYWSSNYNSFSIVAGYKFL